MAEPTACDRCDHGRPCEQFKLIGVDGRETRALYLCEHPEKPRGLVPRTYYCSNWEPSR